MPSRPDLRELAANVKDAFGDMDRETLLEILTFVVKEYVVEGPPPMLVHQAETLADLKNATFAQVISALQTRFDFPELQMFVVDGEQVSVRVGGVMQPLLAARQPLTGQAPAAELPRPAAGVRVVETTLQQRPQASAPAGFIDTRQGPPPAQQPGSAPPPSRGLSVRGRPSGEGEGNVANAPQAQGAQPPPQQPAQPQPGAPQQSDKPDTAGGDDASARFSLLELD
jgi:hypothetical protein